MDKTQTYRQVATNIILSLVLIIGILHLFTENIFLSEFPQVPKTHTISGLLLIFTSAALWAETKRIKISRYSLKLTGIVTALISLITILTYTRWNFVPGTVSFFEIFLHPEKRMAATTAWIILITGIILILYSGRSRWQDDFAHILFFLAIMPSYVMLLGYLLIGYDFFLISRINIAPLTAAGCFLLCTAIILLRPESWLMRMLSGKEAGSIMGRILLPWLLIFPIVISWARIRTIQSSVFSYEITVVLSAVLYSFSFFFLVWITAWSVNKADRSRLKAVQELKKSEKNMKTLLQGSTNTLFRMSPDWKTILSMTGYFFIPESGKPYNMSKYIPSDDLEFVKSEIDLAITKKKALEIEHKVMLPGNTTGWTHTLAIPIIDEKDNIEEWLGIAIDITTRKRAEESLRASENRLHALISASSDMVYLLSPDWNKISFVGEMNDLFSICPSGEGWFEQFIPVSQQEKVRKAINTAINDKSKFELEFQANFSDGSQGWVLSTAVPVLNPKGEIVEWFGTARNITMRKKAEEDLKESRQRWIITLASIGDGVIATDADEKINFMNREAEKITGLRYQDVIGKKLDDILNIDYQNYQEKIHIRKNNVFHIFTHSKLKNKFGKEIPVEYKFNSISDKQGEYWGKVLIIRDITQRENMERIINNYGKHLEEKVRKRTQQLELAKKRAESADQLKTSFLLNMSHELRTPLNSILGFSGILLKQLAGPLNQEQTKQINMVLQSGRHLLSLINEILDISKIEAGVAEKEYESFNFNLMIREVLELFKPMVESKGLKLTFNPDPNMGELTGDKKRINQIFINLINNAVKFTGEGEISISCCRDNDTIVTSVSDTGSGIKEEDMSKLFKPFSKLESSLTRNYEGSGLGLAITKKIIEMLNGSITVKSEYGKGSVFTVSLPVKEKNNNL